MTNIDLKIVFEDNHLLLVVKPYGVPCQADASGDLDMLTLLKQYLVEKYNKPGDAYLGLVHRLDRATGGIMIFAKTSKAASRLCQCFRDGKINKKYLAVVEGEPRYQSDKLTCYLRKFPESNMVKIVPELTEGAKFAELDYKVLETKSNASLLQINLITGRGHQIRVQLAGNNTPIIGDMRYGSQKLKLPLCLWATELRFNHPISDQKMVFRVYPPENMPWTLFDINRYLNITMRNS